MTTRSERKLATRQRLIELAQEELRERGAATLSLRDISRRAGLAPSAVYRHFESRDALLTTLIMAAYERLAEALEAVDARAGWRGRAQALREWALESPHELQLLYGTPVPDYAAPTDTIPAATRVVAAFLEVAPIGADADAGFAAQLADAADELGVTGAQLGWTLRQLAQLVGILLLERGGHFVGSADPADLLWADAVARQAAGEA